MREIRTYGSVGAPGGNPGGNPESTRNCAYLACRVPTWRNRRMAAQRASNQASLTACELAWGLRDWKGTQAATRTAETRLQHCRPFATGRDPSVNGVSQPARVQSGFLRKY